jgi:hypothetical protein
MFGKLFGKDKNKSADGGREPRAGGSDADKAKRDEEAAMGATAATSGATGVIANSG